MRTIEDNAIEGSYIGYGVEIGYIDEINETLVIDFDSLSEAVEHAKVSGGKVVQSIYYYTGWTPVES